MMKEIPDTSIESLHEVTTKKQIKAPLEFILLSKVFAFLQIVGPVTGYYRLCGNCEGFGQYCSYCPRLHDPSRKAPSILLE